MNRTTRFKLAAAAFEVFAPRDFDAFESRLRREVADAAANGARLLVFPEYTAMVLTATFAPEIQRDLRAQIEALQSHRERYLELHRALAREHGVYLLAGSLPWRIDGGAFRNRAWLCAPDGACDFQDKRVMTRFEREQWHIEGGDALKVFDTTLGTLAIATCYDAEFPDLVGAQARAGAQLILVPSCTDTLAGHHRVHVGARARALENQCVVAVASLVGEAPWSPAIDVNVGAAALYGPPDRGFPDDGVLAAGALGEGGWTYAEFDADAIARVRRDGQVLNFAHAAETALSNLVEVQRSVL